MKVLIGCEYSGRVRDEFIKLGHDAVSCDLLPSESSFGPHIQGNILDIINSENWDLFICHPPCTYLSVAGNRAFKEDFSRYEKRDSAFDFAMTLFNANIPKICMENPVGYINTHFRKPDQIIHPYYFGDSELKRTCLWLKGLPKLYYTVQFPLKPSPVKFYKNGYAVYYHDTCKIKGLKKWQARAKTFQGVAYAMASQWGGDGDNYFFNNYLR